MYLRFTTQFINEDDKPEFGIFQALGFIRDHPLTKDDDELKLKELGRRFSNNLEAPHWFSKPKGLPHESKALSWFRDSAKMHIFKMLELIVILEDYDLIVERISIKDPGIIVYEDEFQVSAVPYRWDRKRVI